MYICMYVHGSVRENVEREGRQGEEEKAEEEEEESGEDRTTADAHIYMDMASGVVSQASIYTHIHTHLHARARARTLRSYIYET